MTTQLESFLAIADWQGWRTATEDVRDALGDGVLAVAVQGDDVRHVGVLTEPDTGLVTYVSMRWKLSEKMGGGSARLYRDLNEDDNGGLFGTAVGWLMQPEPDVEPREVTAEKRAALNATVVWCPACGTKGGCVCGDTETPGWDSIDAWDAIDTWEPVELEAQG
jgi:hypothetical protein